MGGLPANAVGRAHLLYNHARSALSRGQNEDGPMNRALKAGLLLLVLAMMAATADAQTTSTLTGTVTTEG